jgi:hypothetical protein
MQLQAHAPPVPEEEVRPIQMIFAVLQLQHHFTALHCSQAWMKSVLVAELGDHRAKLHKPIRAGLGAHATSGTCTGCT